MSFFGLLEFEHLCLLVNSFVSVYVKLNSKNQQLLSKRSSNDNFGHEKAIASSSNLVLNT